MTPRADRPAFTLEVPSAHLTEFAIMVTLLATEQLAELAVLSEHIPAKQRMTIRARHDFWRAINDRLQPHATYGGQHGK